MNNLLIVFIINNLLHWLDEKIVIVYFFIILFFVIKTVSKLLDTELENRANYLMDIYKVYGDTTYAMWKYVKYRMWEIKKEMLFFRKVLINYLANTENFLNNTYSAYFLKYYFKKEANYMKYLNN